MLFAIRLGVVETDEGSANVYVAIAEDRVLAPAIAPSDEEGIRQLVSRAGAEASLLVCEPALGRAAKALGLQTAPPPAWTWMPRAELATVIHLGRSIERSAMAAVAPAMSAARDFVSAAPWRHFKNADAIDFDVVQGGRKRTFEGCIMGAGGGEYGVALYPEAGSLARLARAIEGGRLQDARRIDALGLTIDDHPAWVATAVENALGQPVVIVPLILLGRVVHGINGMDLMLLAAAAGAAAQLDPARTEAAMSCGQGDLATTVVARVRAPSPSQSKQRGTGRQASRAPRKPSSTRPKRRRRPPAKWPA